AGRRNRIGTVRVERIREPAPVSGASAADDPRPGAGGPPLDLAPGGRAGPRAAPGAPYAAAAVALPSLRLSALHLAVAMAVSSGATSLEAAALVSDADAADPADLAVVRELGPSAVVFHPRSNG